MSLRGDGGLNWGLNEFKSVERVHGGVTEFHQITTIFDSPLGDKISSIVAVLVVRSSSLLLAIPPIPPIDSADASARWI